MRICNLCKFYPPACGGIESHLRTLAQAQAKLGLDVQVICVNHADRRGSDVTWRNLARTAHAEENDETVRVVRLGRWGSLARLELCPRLPRLLRSLPSSADLL